MPPPYAYIQVTRQQRVGDDDTDKGVTKSSEVSLSTHPQKNSGSNFAFQRVANSKPSIADSTGILPPLKPMIRSKRAGYPASSFERPIQVDDLPSSSRQKRRSTSHQTLPNYSHQKLPSSYLAETIKRNANPPPKRTAGFLPIAMPRPDPPEELDAEYEYRSIFQAPDDIQIPEKDTNCDATEVSALSLTSGLTGMKSIEPRQNTVVVLEKPISQPPVPEQAHIRSNDPRSSSRRHRKKRSKKSKRHSHTKSSSKTRHRLTRVEEGKASSSQLTGSTVEEEYLKQFIPQKTTEHDESSAGNKNDNVNSRFGLPYETTDFVADETESVDIWEHVIKRRSESEKPEPGEGSDPSSQDQAPATSSSAFAEEAADRIKEKLSARENIVIIDTTAMNEEDIASAITTPRKTTRKEDRRKARRSKRIESDKVNDETRHRDFDGEPRKNEENVEEESRRPQAETSKPKVKSLKPRVKSPKVKTSKPKVKPRKPEDKPIKCEDEKLQTKPSVGDEAETRSKSSQTENNKITSCENRQETPNVSGQNVESNELVIREEGVENVKLVEETLIQKFSEPLSLPPFTCYVPATKAVVDESTTPPSAQPEDSNAEESLSTTSDIFSTSMAYIQSVASDLSNQLQSIQKVATPSESEMDGMLGILGRELDHTSKNTPEKRDDIVTFLGEELEKNTCGIDRATLEQQDIKINEKDLLKAYALAGRLDVSAKGIDPLPEIETTTNTYSIKMTSSADSALSVGKDGDPPAVRQE